VEHVDLRASLFRVASARDLGPLFAALGYAPANEPFEDDTWVVARWRGFRVVATPATPARDRVRQLAARLARAGERALAVGVEPGAVVLAAPRIGAEGATRLLVAPCRDPSPLVVQQLEELTPRRRGTALDHALRLVEVLSSEAAGRRFFSAFRAILERMTAALDAPGSDADRRMAVLLQLTRVLFLYFVQAKGWLDGQPDYLRRVFDHAVARRKAFHRSILHPLFFGTLNRRPAERARRPCFGAIPYLNGGLFEPHPVERRLGHIVLSNELWCCAFDDVFERFRFCVRESEEVNAIAPDMLGHVFERVMDDDERHATGTFYTPEAVVRDVVDATIETALAGRAGITPALARRIVLGETLTAREGSAARRALARLHILDPAAGSGAFLLGALARLTDMRAPLERCTRHESLRRLRLDVLRNNLFGVDRSPVAVRLAELRLWLAVIADDPTTEIARVAPLPNLDGVVRQGDSLLDAIAAFRSFTPGRPPGIAPRAPATRGILQARVALFEARGDARAAAAQRLREAELAWAREAVAACIASADHRMRELQAVARGRDLFGRRSGLTREQRATYRRLQEHRADLDAAARAVADGSVPFFSFEVHAPDVAAAGGFDAVVGNPPWVRAERLPAAMRRALAARFRWWKAGPGRGFGHLPDLAVAFLERGVELAAPGGAVGLLLPSKVVTAAYAQVARTHMVRETSIAYLHRVPDREAQAFGATTYPLAAILKTQAPEPDHDVRLDFREPGAVRQQSLGSTWVLVPDREREALAEFHAAGVPLGRLAPPSLGAKTGADRLFVGELTQLDADCAVVAIDGTEVSLETSVLRPALRGRNVRPFHAVATRVLFCAHRPAGDCRTRLPPRAAAYVATRERRFRARADYRDGPPWTLFRIRPALAANRVVWPDIARRPVAVALDETPFAHAVPLNTCYVAAAPDRNTALTIAAVFNSTWARASAFATADEARGGYRRINARVAGAFPVPPAGPAATALCALSTAAHDGHQPGQDDLDEAVAETLALSRATRDALRRLVAHRR
jgi:hypothetical protein